MVRYSQLIKLMLFAAILSGCQKAKMTHRKPILEPTPPITHQPAPQPVPHDPGVIPIPPIDNEPEEDIIIGPDPELPEFRPSPATPITDDGRSLDPDAFTQNQQAGVQPGHDGKNFVEWFESGYSQPRLKDCGPECKPKQIPPKEYQCKTQSLPATPKTDKIDILFVVDTSASMKEERSLIASQMGAFIDELNPNIDYQIGVMPAHGPSTKKSPGNFYGRLYSAGSHDPSVIKYRGLQGKAGVVKDLVGKMKNLPNDRSDAQGEVGLLGLYAGLINKDLKDQMVSRDRFLREDAALAVIFVADENDACYDYRKGGTPNYDGSGKRDPVEQRTFDGLCKLGNGQQLDPQLVLKALNYVKRNMPVILTGIVYTSDVIPKKGDKYAPENEKGRGYLDLIRLGHGMPVDLADKNFGKSLGQLGNYSQFKMDFDNVFACKTSVSSSQIDLSTFNVQVKSKSGKLLGKFHSKCAKNSKSCPKGVHPALAEIDPSGSSDEVKVYLRLDEFQKIAEPSAKIEMSFKTLGRVEKSDD